MYAYLSNFTIPFVLRSSLPVGWVGMEQLDPAIGGGMQAAPAATRPTSMMGTRMVDIGRSPFDKYLSTAISRYERFQRAIPSMISPLKRCQALHEKLIELTRAREDVPSLHRLTKTSSFFFFSSSVG